MFDHCKKNVWPLCKGTKTLFVPVIRNIFPPVSNNHGHFILGSITMLYLCTQNFNAFAMDVRGGWLNFFLNYCFPFLRPLRSFCNHQIGSFTKWAVFYFLHSNFIRLCLFCTRNEKGHIRIISIFFQYVQNDWNIVTFVVGACSFPILLQKPILI